MKNEDIEILEDFIMAVKMYGFPDGTWQGETIAEILQEIDNKKLMIKLKKEIK